MSRSMFKVCRSTLQRSTSLPPSNLLKLFSKCSVSHVSDRSYFLNYTLGDRKCKLPPYTERKTEETFSFQSFSIYESYKTRQERRSKICEILQCSEVDAQDILEQANSQCAFDDPEMFYEKLQRLCQAGFDSSNISKNMWLFSISLGELEKRLEVLRQRNPGVPSLNEVNLLKLSRIELANLVDILQEDEKCNMETRIDYFCRIFKIEVHEVCAFLVERSFLRRKPLNEIIKIFNLLLDAGVTTEEIKSDLWVFKHKPETLVERINLSKRLGFDQFKCWMSRCPLDHLKRSAYKLESDKKALKKFSSREKLLMCKLEINEEALKRIYAMYPQLEKVREAKLLYMFDFLISENFNKDHILVYPRILCHSPRTLKKRLNELRELGFEVQNLHTVGKTQKDYAEFIKKVKANNFLKNRELEEALSDSAVTDDVSRKVIAREL